MGWLHIANTKPIQVFHFMNSDKNGTGKNGTGKNVTSKNGKGKIGTGKNGTGRNGTGNNGTSKNGTGKNGTGKNGALKNGTGNNDTNGKVGENRTMILNMPKPQTQIRTPNLNPNIENIICFSICAIIACVLIIYVIVTGNPQVETILCSKCLNSLISLSIIVV